MTQAYTIELGYKKTYQKTGTNKKQQDWNKPVSSFFLRSIPIFIFGKIVRGSYKTSLNLPNELLGKVSKLWIDNGLLNVKFQTTFFDYFKMSNKNPTSQLFNFEYNGNGVTLQTSLMMMNLLNLIYSATSINVQNNTMTINVNSSIMNRNLEELAQYLGGESLTTSKHDDEYHNSYTFVDEDFVIENGKSLSVEKRMKHFMTQLPTNVYIRYIYKTGGENMGRFDDKRKYILYPEMKSRGLEEMNNADEYIFKNATVHTSRFNHFNSSIKRFVKDYLGYDFIKRKIGMLDMISTPEFSVNTKK